MTMNNLKKVFFLAILLVSLSCSTTKKMSNNFEVVKTPVSNSNESKSINELRFNDVRSAMSTQKLMFDNYGKWDREVRYNNEEHPMLVWENVKIFDDQDQKYSISAQGIESSLGMYASLVVYDNKGNNCLSDNHPKRETLVKFFREKMHALSKDRKFYDVYWKMVTDYKKRRKSM